jgi:hypothetical protein
MPWHRSQWLARRHDRQDARCRRHPALTLKIRQIRHRTRRTG